MIEIPPHIRGLVFDCDGTIADTMPAHYKSWVAALGEHGVEFPEAMFYEMGGIPTPRIIEILNERHGHDMPVDETAHRKEAIFEETLHAVLPIQPVVDVIRAYDGRLPMAVATGGYRHIATKTLKILGLFDKFQALVCAEDVKHGKPAADVFLEAARRINVDPKLCMAFEDANLGVESATAAGMLVVDVRKYGYGPKL
ncbi:MAG: HAD-IA family hydrolase [Burkholderiales bacterium]|nr:HAD-IA family hydrolase [Phycisphaerae bacterium]